MAVSSSLVAPRQSSLWAHLAAVRCVPRRGKEAIIVSKHGCVLVLLPLSGSCACGGGAS